MGEKINVGNYVTSRSIERGGGREGVSGVKIDKQRSR